MKRVSDNQFHKSKAFGPELGFGYVMGAYHDEPVIVMKADIGNRSLGWDILPPESERYTFEGKEYPGYKEMLNADGKVVPWDGEGWYAGKQYDEYTAAIRAVLDNFGERYPEYADQGFEVAGFAWWQGHQDSGSAPHMAARRVVVFQFQPAGAVGPEGRRGIVIRHAFSPASVPERRRAEVSPISSARGHGG